jgi:O-antigen/teichoic acid export membrane protein
LIGCDTIQLDKKFWNDTLWNYLSLVLQAIVGVALNFLILRYGVADLGVFNQIYAIYVIAGQIAVCGLNDSAQKHVAEHADNIELQRTLSIAAIAAVLLTGLIGSVTLALLSKLIEKLTKSENVGLGVLLISPGLFFFAINKVLMGILNGQRRMAAFALGASMRAILILIICLIIIMHKGESYEFGAAFTISEILLFIFMLLYVRDLCLKKHNTGTIKQWMNRHMKFGTRALIHGFLTEAFFRIDIIILGIFLADREVGIYSFAAFFVEGIYQIPIVIRNITNPILVPMLIGKDKRVIIHFSRKVASISFLATAAISVAIIIIYPFLKYFVSVETIDASYPILMILLVGLILYSFCIPFDYLLLQSGRPGMQSIYMLMNSSMNAVLNFCLIPFFGLYGACTATAIAFAFSGINLNILASKILGFRRGLFIGAYN